MKYREEQIVGSHNHKKMLDEYERKREEKTAQWNDKITRFAATQKMASVDPEIQRQKDLLDDRKREE